MSKKIIGTKYWTGLAKWWRKVAPPVRPSRADLKIYEKFLRKAIKKRRPRILILGSTPEMRDLAAKFKAETTVCDISLEMMMAMSQLMRYKKAVEKEIWVRAGWVTVPLQHNYYDIILGDGVTTNISWSEANQWWKHLSELLKPWSAFIARVCYLTPKKEANKNLNNLLEKISRKKKLSLVDLGELKVALEIVNYNPKTRTVSTADYKKLFFDAIKGHSVSLTGANKIYQKLIRIYSPKPVKIWRAPTKKQTEQEAKRYFKIIKEFPCPSWSANGTIYFLRKR